MQRAYACQIAYKIWHLVLLLVSIAEKNVFWLQQIFSTFLQTDKMRAKLTEINIFTIIFQKQNKALNLVVRQKKNASKTAYSHNAYTKYVEL